VRAERVRTLLDRAKRYRAMLDSGEGKSMRELGRVEGISGVRGPRSPAPALQDIDWRVN
jgi:hypothetical protein